jgi:threonine/homoserine/homoserine lactone efflux protein
VDKITDLLRSIARPAVTIIFAAVIAQVVTQGIDAPEWFIGLASTVILWWFSDRTYHRLKDGKANSNTNK